MCGIVRLRVRFTCNFFHYISFWNSAPRWQLKFQRTTIFSALWGWIAPPTRLKLLFDWCPSTMRSWWLWRSCGIFVVTFFSSRTLCMFLWYAVNFNLCECQIIFNCSRINVPKRVKSVRWSLVLTFCCYGRCFQRMLTRVQYLLSLLNFKQITQCSKEFYASKTNCTDVPCRKNKTRMRVCFFVISESNLIFILGSEQCVPHNMESTMHTSRVLPVAIVRFIALSKKQTLVCSSSQWVTTTPTFSIHRRSTMTIVVFDFKWLRNSKMERENSARTKRPSKYRHVALVSNKRRTLWLISALYSIFHFDAVCWVCVWYFF